MTPDRVKQMVAEAGAEPGRVWVGTPAPDVPPPPEDSWAIVDAGGRFVLGGVERGKFAEYETYPRWEVIKPLPEDVVQGRVTPWFEQPGGGVQYKFSEKMTWYEEHGYLRRLDPP